LRSPAGKACKPRSGSRPPPRAGAILAAQDLQTGTGNAWNDATLAINQEEGVTNVYQNSSPSADNYVNMTPETLNAAGQTISVVKISIIHAVVRSYRQCGSCP